MAPARVRALLAGEITAATGWPAWSVVKVPCRAVTGNAPEVPGHCYVHRTVVAIAVWCAPVGIIDA